MRFFSSRFFAAALLGRTGAAPLRALMYSRSALCTAAVAVREPAKRRASATSESSKATFFFALMRQIMPHPDPTTQIFRFPPPENLLQFPLSHPPHSHPTHSHPTLPQPPHPLPPTPPTPPSPNLSPPQPLFHSKPLTLLTLCAMRLTALKLEGFKSFADPVQLGFAGGLIGVVGPNGGGKSNLIDAVRWALGESRSSALRGESLPDILFNGGNRRAPADWCAVELVFENDKKRDLGMWSAAAEITARRELSRDGQSSFIINNTAVRRRDLVDLFRGAGITARACGVVEQGMVAQVAESSPERLRAFLEEAAGVAHYKERRRETERRLSHSRENLRQLQTSIAENEKRIESLKRQARAARRQRELTVAINETDALLISERRRKAMESLAQKRAELKAADDNLSAARAELEKWKDEAARRRANLDAAARAVEEKQSAAAAATAAAQAAERDAQRSGESRENLQARLAADREALETLEADSNSAAEESRARDGEIRGAENLRKELAEEEIRLGEELADREARRRELQTAADRAREALAEIGRKSESDQVRRKMLAGRISELESRASETENELKKAQGESPADSRVASELQECEKRLRECAERARKATEGLEDARERARALENAAAVLSAERDALLAVFPGDDWPGGEAPERLARALKVDAGKWARALDAALGRFADARAVPDLDAFLSERGLPPSGAAVVETDKLETESEPSLSESPSSESVSQAPEGAVLLLEKVSAPPESLAVLRRWLRGIFAVESDEVARGLRGRLRAGEMVVTPDGAGYLRGAVVVRGEARAGFEWEGRVAELNRAIAGKRKEAEGAAVDLASAKTVSDKAEAERAEAEGAALAKRVAAGQAEERARALESRRENLAAELGRARDEARGLAGQVAEIDASAREQSSARAEAEAAHSSARENLAADEAELEKCRDALHQAALKRREADLNMESARRRVAELKKSAEANSARRGELRARLAKDSKQFAELDDSVLQKRLAECRKTAEGAEADLRARRKAREKAEGENAAAEKERDARFSGMEKLQNAAADLRVAERELSISADRLGDSLEELDVPVARLNELRAQKKAADGGEGGEGAEGGEGGEALSAERLNAEMEALRAKRDKLGAINFMADAELRELEEGLEKTRTQRDDISAAAAHLENAMRQIDRETKARLAGAFEGVNREFPGLFSRMFGGGEARLEMSGDSPLDAEFEIKARPPGKRQSPVRALSGGEKAAAALAFIIAVLKLNPPPFCLLDEVDAPLDDSRTERLARILEEVSGEVQCLVVTHNRGTMEAMDRLVGVTQEEPGVSKIVTVSVAEAARYAA